MSTPAVTSARATARTLAPVLSMGATWAARKGMIKAYESKTGKPAPLVRSRQAPVLEKVLWAAAMSGWPAATACSWPGGASAAATAPTGTAATAC